MNQQQSIERSIKPVFGRLVAFSTLANHPDVFFEQQRSSNRGKVYRLPIIVMVISLLLLMQVAQVTRGSHASTAPLPSVTTEAFVPDEILIGLKPEVVRNLISQGALNSRSAIAAFDLLNQKYGVQNVSAVFPQLDLADPVVLQTGLAGVFKLTVSAGTDIFAMIREYQSHPAVAYAEPNYIFHAASLPVPNDPEFDQQWGLHNTGQTGGGADADIDAPEAWGVTMGSSSILVAVLDTGVNYNHPDLVGQVRTDIDRDFVNNDDDAMDDHGHGTFCAGIISAKTNNAAGIAGVCPNCRILPVKVLNSNGSGTSDNVARGIRYAADMQARIISMSLGYKSSCGCSKTVASAINYAFGKGSLLIAASGNDSDKQRLSYPASSSRVVAVGATDHKDVEATFSNRSPAIDIFAPGVNIRSLDLQGYRTASGTSAATPYVAGAAGLLWSIRPAMTHVQVWWQLRHTADDMQLHTAAMPATSQALGSELQAANNLQRRAFIPRVSLSPSSIFVRTTPGRLNAHRALTFALRLGEVYAPQDGCNQEPNCVGDCAAEVALSGTADESSDLRLLRDFADNTLAESAVGREWVELYQRHRLETVLILASDRKFRAEALAALKQWLPVIAALTYPDRNSVQPVILSHEQAEALEHVVAGLSARGSSQLRADLEKVTQTLKVRRFIGQEVGSAWRELNAGR